MHMLPDNSKWPLIFFPSKKQQQKAFEFYCLAEGDAWILFAEVLTENHILLHAFACAFHDTARISRVTFSTSKGLGAPDETLLQTIEIKIGQQNLLPRTLHSEKLDVQKGRRAVCKTNAPPPQLSMVVQLFAQFFGVRPVRITSPQVNTLSSFGWCRALINTQPEWEKKKEEAFWEFFLISK